MPTIKELTAKLKKLRAELRNLNIELDSIGKEEEKFTYPLSMVYDDVINSIPSYDDLTDGELIHLPIEKIENKLHAYLVNYSMAVARLKSNDKIISDLENAIKEKYRECDKLEDELNELRIENSKRNPPKTIKIDGRTYVLQGK